MDRDTILVWKGFVGSGSILGWERIMDRDQFWIGK